MRIRFEGRSGAEPSRPLLAAALSLMGIGALLFFGAAVLETSANPAGHRLADDLRMALPYVGVLGLAAMVVWLATRQPSPASRARRADAIVFGESTEFADEDHPARSAPPAAAARRRVRTTDMADLDED